MGMFQFSDFLAIYKLIKKQYIKVYLQLFFYLNTAQCQEWQHIPIQSVQAVFGQRTLVAKALIQSSLWNYITMSNYVNVNMDWRWTQEESKGYLWITAM